MLYFSYMLARAPKPGRRLVVIALTAALWLPLASAQTSPQHALLERYCFSCHNEKLKTGGVALEKMDLNNIAAGASTWEKVLRKIHSGEMPPRSMPRPDSATATSFASWLESALDRAAAAKPNPGRPAIHRLNRAEYNNAIRDLLALELDLSSSLPADDSGYGFDNIGDVLSVSPLLLERYLSLSRKVSRLAVGDPSMKPVVEEYPVAAVLQNDRVSEDLPFGSRGGVSMQHYFPLDAEYSIKAKLRVPGQFARTDGPPKLDIRLDGARVKLFDAGMRGQQSDEEPGVYQVRIPVKAGNRLVGVDFYDEFTAPEGILALRPNGAAPARNVVRRANIEYVQIGGPFEPTGPGETASRKKIFVCHAENEKEELPCASKILSTLARGAYRRPITDADMRPLLSFYETGRRSGSFDAGIEMALRRMLVSPDFLFRLEHDPQHVTPGSVYRLSDIELASRLSFFLWSSIPDDELLGLAEHGKLKDPAAFEQQVHRMLMDNRSKALITNFAGQWLYLRNLALMKPDPDAFPEFDEGLRQAFRRETELFLETILREDRSVTDLLNADFTFLNERLARHYGIADVHGSSFRRVALTDANRFGLLGQGSILTVTSYPTRTSPVLRGKWILENLLGTPPPPPPANVPDLKDHGEDGKVLPVRQRMELHRANATCAACHARLDPIGFALENYDGVGKWRTSDSNAPIDPSGALPDGTPFDGPAGLRKALLNRREDFAATVTEKLLTYALGRGLEYYDQPTVRSIVRESARDDYRISAIILAIAKSTPFQMRRAQ